MIGRGVKCPKCDASFRVPDPRRLSTGAASSDEIEFLCPNGHKLSGPANLQGKAGKCHHCEARFIIPDYSQNEDPSELDANNDATFADLPELEELQPLDAIADDQEVTDLPAARNPIAMLPQSADPFGADPFGFVENPAAHPAGVEPAAATGHPLAILFESFWARRGPAVHVEFHLANGDKLRPDYYAPDLSRQFQGVFGIKQEDGTYMITAVAWDAVQRITLRGVPEFPSDVFPSNEKPGY